MEEKNTFITGYRVKKDNLTYLDRQQMPQRLSVNFITYNTPELRYFSEIGLLTNPDCFEPVYENYFNLGDLVYVEASLDNELLNGTIQKVTGTNYSSHKPTVLLEGFMKMYPFHCFRKARPEEIARYELVKEATFNGLTPVFKQNQVHYQGYPLYKNELQAYIYLLRSPLDAKITLGGKEVTKDLLRKMIAEIGKNA